MSALLEVKELQTAYGQSQILFGIDLKIFAGGFATLLGRNGMGKTTTVRSILGLTPAQSGTVYFLGERIDQLSPDRIARMGMAVVPEGRLIFPTLTVTENLKAFAANRNASSAPWTLERVFALFPRLAERSRNMGNQLSGGEQQMLAIGRGLMSEPALLIMDEPSLGLSPLLVEQMFELITKINKEGMPILLMEQNAVQTLAIAHRAYIIENGQVAMQGRASDMARDPELRKNYLGL